MTDSTAPPNNLTFAQLLDALGYRSGEYVSILHTDPGGTPTARIQTPGDAAQYAATVSPTHHVYFGVNPVRNVRTGRGTAADVTRLAALYADLDVKPGACQDIAHAEDIVNTLSDILGVRPTAVVHSGSGLHPYWPIDDGDTDAYAVGALLRRWGRLVAVVAARHGAKVDTVYDLPRVLRVPGTVNAKNGAVVVAHVDVGAPLTVTEVDERLTEFGVSEEDGDTVDDAVVSDPSTWQPGTQTSTYMRTLIDGIPAERPPKGRHQWAASQAVRLACALRLGCLTQTDYRHAETLLAARLRVLRTKTGETVSDIEVPALMVYGKQRAATKTDTQTWDEVGGQQHRDSWDKQTTMSESMDSDDDADTSGGGDDDGVKHSWMPLDLADVLDGTWQPPTPTVGRRSDGVGLFYPGKKHTVSSESEAGKTWFALAACRDEILRENHVFYYDFEDDKGPVVARLMLLGVGAKQINEFFHYVRPETPIFLAPHGADVADTLDRYRPTLAVLDGVTEAMTLHELNPLDNADAAKFGRMVPRLLADSGAAAVSLDHVTKSAEGRGRYSIGAVHKLNGLDGAAYILDNRRPFGVNMQGVSTVRIAKDRPGQLRSKAVPSGKGGLHWFADLIVDTTLEGMTEGVVTVAPAVDQGNERRPTIIMGRICAALADRPDGLAQRVLGTVVTGGTDTIRDALDYLIADGYVTQKTPHKLIRPYLPNEDFRGDDDDDE